jgi:hypothetical protein
MTLSRRNVLLGGGAIVALGGVYLATTKGLRATLERRFDLVFGPEYARHAEARNFLDAYLGWMSEVGLPVFRQAERMAAWLPVPLSEQNASVMAISDHAAELFLRSTNVVRSYETGEAFEFSGLFYPYDMPCANRLAAQWV